MHITYGRPTNRQVETGCVCDDAMFCLVPFNLDAASNLAVRSLRYLVLHYSSTQKARIEEGLINEGIFAFFKKKCRAVYTRASEVVRHKYVQVLP